MNSVDHRTLIKIYDTHRVFWWVCALVLIVNLGVYFFYVRKGVSEIGRLQDAYRSKRTEMAALTRKQSENRILVASRQALDRFWNTIGPKDHFPDQVRKLKHLTETRRLAVERIAFTPQRLDSLGLWRYETLLTARGAYGQLKGLLADIQNLEGLFCLENFSLNREKPGAPITMKAKVIVYLSETGPEA